MRHRLIPCAFLLVFACLQLHTAWDKSPTWDEVGYLGLGAYLARTGHWDVPAAGSHPPLAFYLHSLPTFFFPIDWSPWRYRHVANRDLGFLRAADVHRGNAMLLSRAYDGELLLLACRATSLVLAAVLFVVLYRWTLAVAGELAAVVASLLLCLSPNCLAHAALITTDFPLAVTYSLATWATWRFLQTPTHIRLMLAGGALGLALLTKLTALLLLPTLALIGLSYGLTAARDRMATVMRLFPEGWHLGRWSALASACTAICGIALGVLWAGYGFQVQPYVMTLRSQAWDIACGHSAYLLGRFSTTGWWYYFPLAMAVKTPVPTLILCLMGVFHLAQTARRHPQGLWWTAALLIPPGVLLLAFVIAGSKNIGLRYLLPVYPFLFLAAGAGAARLWATGGRLTAMGRGLGIALLVWYVVSAGRIHPDHLAYFNELAGGPDQGYKILVDSNLDWGQDLKGLKRYMRDHGIERVKLSYFGSVDPAVYDLHYEWLPSFLLPRPPGCTVQLPTTGLIAISVTNLVGVYMDQYGHGHGLFAWLRRYEPMARIGHSIYLYDIPATTSKPYSTLPSPPIK